MSAWTTTRTSGLSMPMPKALVAAITWRSAVDEALLDVLLGLRREIAVEIVRHPLPLAPQEFRHLLGLSSGGAVHDGPACSIPRQVGLQDLVNVGKLALAAGGHHHEIQVGALSAAVKHSQSQCPAHA